MPSALTVSGRDGSVRSRNGAWSLRNSHVALGVLGDGAVSAVAMREVELGFHSPGFCNANVTAITEVDFEWGWF